MGKKQPFLPIFGHFGPFETILKLQNILKLHKNMENVGLYQNHEKISVYDVIIGIF